jgi:hypothetical protein
MTSRENERMGGLPGRTAMDGLTRAQVKILKELGDDVERLRAALMDARDALHNDFEPDNQSPAWHRANKALGFE